MSATLDSPISDTPGSATTVAGPTPTEFLHGFVGFVVLAACAGLGAGDAMIATRTVPTGLLVGGGALALTGPTLIAMHQFLGLKATPDALAASLLKGFATTGRAALGLCPTMLLFAATSGLWAPVLLILGSIAGALGFRYTFQRLVEAEGEGSVAFGLLITAWAGLVALIALRLTVDAARFAVGG
jgi:hypothetical protein